MTNRLFYTAKFKSGYINNYNGNVSKNFKSLLSSSMIISLADSQMLRTIRDISWESVTQDEYEEIKHLQNLELSLYNKIDKCTTLEEKQELEKQLYKIPVQDKYILDLTLLEYWYRERDRIKKKSNSDFCKNRMTDIQNKIYTMMYIPEYVTVVIDEIKHYKTFFKDGFVFNGRRYKRFSCSAGQARVSTVVFIAEDIRDKVMKRLNNGAFEFDENGMSNVKFAPSKYNAYFGLYSSATKRVTAPRFCIIPDFLETKKVKVDYVIETDEKSDDIIEPREIDVEFNRFDGGGLITPQMAEQWSKDIGVYTPDNIHDPGYISCQFCFRWSFAKGMLNTFDIVQWCIEKNNGNFIIEDIYGDNVDLREIDVILTEGQTKCWNLFGFKAKDDEGNIKIIPSQEVYERNCEEMVFIGG